MFTFNCRGRLRVLEEPAVMGVINVTPDSFFPGSRQQTVNALLHQADKMIREGALILDIGGQSTRPGSQPVSAEEEWQRIAEPLKALHRAFPEQWISVDTYYASVAEAAVEAGAGLVNDISAGRLDPELLPTVARMQVPYVLMHMQGTPGTMQQAPVYEEVTRDVLDFFILQVNRLREAGITDILLDPGFGFGKTLQHNFRLLKNLDIFRMLERPVLAGLSRKSMITRTLGIQPEEALHGTSALHMLALQNGALLLRAHDVKEAAEVIALFRAYRDA